MAFALHSLAPTVVVGGIATPLTTNKNIKASWVAFRAPASNSAGGVYIGGPETKASTKTGIPLAPGDTFFFTFPTGIMYYDPSQIYIDGGVNGDIVCVIYAGG